VSVASTIVIAREDLSIPGAVQATPDQTNPAKDAGRRLFALLRESKADVVVLNLTVTEGRGVQAIRQVREQSAVPIVVVCASHDPRVADYRTAGAADCLHPPVDITVLSRSIQNVAQPVAPQGEVRPHERQGYRFQGITYRPDQSSLTAAEGAPVILTTEENDVLQYLVARSWTVCGPAEIAEVTCGDSTEAAQQAVPALVRRLRKKLGEAVGAGAGPSVKTEPRRGYMLIADVEAFPIQESPRGA
jgi:DNA-binding response OmpR family regulator